jgi:23S rRNA (pseudouridine1915-N3)-methyltransferase
MSTAALWSVAQVLKAISPGERVVLLDERGRDASSEDVARLLIKASDDGTPLCFVIGGPFGHGAAVMQRGDESIRLSRMVLNHSVAYVVLVEQLYRAWTIVRGEPYHH